MPKKRTMPKKAGRVKTRTKTEIFGELAEMNNLTRKQVASVFDGLTTLIEKDLGKRGTGIFTIPGLTKLKVVRKPATKARKGISPFTGEEMIFKAKPARRVVKAVPLKRLKEMV